jgi:hypothetical protein
MYGTDHGQKRLSVDTQQTGLVAWSPSCRSRRGVARSSTRTCRDDAELDMAQHGIPQLSASGRGLRFKLRCVQVRRTLTPPVRSSDLRDAPGSCAAALRVDRHRRCCLTSTQRDRRRQRKTLHSAGSNSGQSGAIRGWRRCERPALFPLQIDSGERPARSWFGPLSEPDSPALPLGGNRPCIVWP